MKLLIGKACSALTPEGDLTPHSVGSRVVERRLFFDYLRGALSQHDFRNGEVTGQALITFPEEYFSSVLPGVTERLRDRRQYFYAAHRGELIQCLPRPAIMPAVRELVVCVYTAEAYVHALQLEPRVDQGEIERIGRFDTPLIITAVIASPTEGAALSPKRLVRNLAGENVRYHHERLTPAQVVEIAKRVVDFNRRWATVADRELATNPPAQTELPKPLSPPKAVSIHTAVTPTQLVRAIAALGDNPEVDIRQIVDAAQRVVRPQI